ncbi:MAG TPA: class I SAM-dependent methyltransferase [Tepidisphaeraceae bacterium]|jgi:predicted O-methyltransferase YrrM|nr:class I SAM-dependent methyltransferase [Tepidisphaeraceae bacterium]
MPQYAQSIRKLFHKVDPFTDFDFASRPLDLQGGGGTPIMQQVFDASKPKLVVEVGTWKGKSAVWWAEQMRDKGIDGAVVCIDTWLGGLDHITRPRGPGWDIDKYFKNGYSTLYYQFLANICQKGVQDYIVPIPTTSSIGARWLAHHNLQPDLVYVDASHEEDDVYDDLKNYWKVLKNGAFMCGDDWAVAWHGVICAVNRFARENDIRLQVGGNTWVLQKTLSSEQQLVLHVMTEELNKLKQTLPKRMAA